MRKIGLVFPGQGAQYVGMGKEIYEKYSFVREMYETASDILKLDLAEVIQNGSIETLKETAITQPVVFVTEMAAFKVFEKEVQLKPVISAGHSLGEISALTAAGTMTFETAVDLVKHRALAMKQAVEENEGIMCAITRIHYETVEKVCKQYRDKDVAISNYNAINQTVIAGNKEDVMLVCHELENLGANITQLKVQGAFHSPYMQSAAEYMKGYLQEINFKEFSFPVIGNVDAKMYNSCDEIAYKLARQIVSPVQWTKTVRAFESLGIDTVIEIGPGKVLSKLNKQNSSYMNSFCFEKVQDIEKVIEEKQKHYTQDQQDIVSKCIAASICTRNRNFDKDEYEKVILNHKDLLNLKEKIEREQREPNLDEKQKAVALLKQILELKKVSDVEKNERLKAIGF